MNETKVEALKRSALEINRELCNLDVHHDDLGRLYREIVDLSDKMSSSLERGIFDSCEMARFGFLEFKKDVRLIELAFRSLKEDIQIVSNELLHISEELKEQTGIIKPENIEKADAGTSTSK